QLPHHRCRGVRGRQAREPALRESLRHGAQVRGRGLRLRSAGVPEEALKRDPGLYDYLPYDRRPKIAWPDGARVAFWVAPNIEFYELDPPQKPARTAWAAPRPDGPN